MIQRSFQNIMIFTNPPQKEDARVIKPVYQVDRHERYR